MPEAFTQVSRLSELGRRSSYRNRVTMHWVLQTVSVALAGVGVACIFINKNQYKVIFGLSIFLLYGKMDRLID